MKANETYITPKEVWESVADLQPLNKKEKQLIVDTLSNPTYLGYDDSYIEFDS